MSQLQCTTMDPFRSENYLDFVRRKNASRPSVIYFHGLLSNEESLEKGDTRDVLSENGHDVKRCLSLQDERYTNEEKRNPKENTTICSQELQCLETEEDCLRKRHRTSFTTSQLHRLEEEFEEDCYIVGMKRWRLSEELEIPEKQIKIWFQNKRTKVKKHCTSCAHRPRDGRERVVN